MHWPAVRFNALVEEALHANPDVSAAQAALRQANHGAGRGASGLGQRRRGCGAAGRHDMGLVIFAGLSIGTLLTLFMVPAMYMFGARRVELLWELACLRWPHRVLPDTPRCLHR